MNRRDFSLAFLGALAAGAAGFAGPAAATTSADSGPAATGRDSGKRHIAFLLFEGMTALDLIGPATVLTNSGQFDVDYVWRDMHPVTTESKANRQLALTPTATFDMIEATDILCVPGTSNPYDQIRQQDLIAWVTRVGAKATFVTSVCSGSFILGAAGLLRGYKATSHWALLDQLAAFGAIPTTQRVVQDRNRITGAGVTSGIDFGLELLARLCGEDAAQSTQLILEYDPKPPFPGGSPQTASPQLVAAARGNYAAYLEKVAPYARQSLDAVAKRLGVAYAPKTP